MPDKKGKLSWNEMAKNLYYETTKKKKKKEYPQFLNPRKNPLLPGILASYKNKQIKNKKIEKERQDSISKAFLEKIQKSFYTHPSQKKDSAYYDSLRNVVPKKFKKGGKLKGGNRDMFSQQYD